LHVTAVKGLLRPFDGPLASLDSPVGLGQHKYNAPERGEAGIQTPILRIVGQADGGRHYQYLSPGEAAGKLNSGPRSQLVIVVVAQCAGLGRRQASLLRLVVAPRTPRPGRTASSHSGPDRQLLTGPSRVVKHFH
jgi:hypothetical protein